MHSPRIHLTYSMRLVFNRMNWGDPIHDFLKAGMFSSEVSIPFSIGQIKGYHANRESW